MPASLTEKARAFLQEQRFHGEETAKRQMEEQFSKEQRITLRLKCENIIEYL